LPLDAAAAGTAPSRLLVVFTPMGYLESAFWPERTADGTDWTLGETMAALRPWKSKLIYPDGLSMYPPNKDNEHGRGIQGVFTGADMVKFPTGPSIDQVVARKLASETALSYPSLPFSVNVGDKAWEHNTCFSAGDQQPIVALGKPVAVFDTLFKNLSETGPTMDTAGADRLRKKKQSVIDFVRADLDRVCKQLGADDQQKCQAHLEALRGAERRVAGLSPIVTSGCTKPVRPVAGNDLIINVHAQMDMISAALACGLTRVATLQLGMADGGLDMISGVNQHNTTHKTGDTKGTPAQADHIANHKRIDMWFADRWAYLLRKLEAVKEGEGTLLDNTLIVFGSDTTTSMDPALSVGAHAHHRFPFWMAGGGNFAFKTGRHIVFPHPADGKGDNWKRWTRHHRLLVSIARAFGVEANSFGALDTGSGPLPML